jgi:sulfatase modifying factor 1
MSTAQAAACAAALMCLIACSARVAPNTAQILLYVDTDAPIASPSNPALGLTDPLPLFDRVRIDLFPPGAPDPCDGCSNDFGIDADQLRTGASVGLVPDPGVVGYRARVRLYRGAFATPAGDPDPGTTVDVTVSLLPIGTLGIVEQTVLLPTDDVGQPQGSLAAPLAPTAGRPASSAVGTWGPATRVPCSGPAGAAEVCIPGGAYWMGNPLAVNLNELDEGTHPRLVVVSPYFLRTTEVTVQEFRASGARPVNEWSGGTNGTAWADWCTFAPSPRPCSMGFPCEDDVQNCVTWAEARAYCVSSGGDLPTEAQYEYAASGTQSQLYVWGEDAPQCGDATYGASGGTGQLLQDVGDGCPMTGFGGPTLPGEGKLDALITMDGTVVDLAGNVSEWARDVWNRDDELCWSVPGVYTNPLCQTPSLADGFDHAVRGGEWFAPPLNLHAAGRVAEGQSGPGELMDQGDIGVGFRCARPG